MEYHKLEDISEIIAGQSPPSDSYNKTGEGLPFFQGKADFGKKYPTPRVWCSAPIKIAEENDILISVRAPVGAVNLNNAKASIGRGLSAIRVNNAYSQYLYYYLKSQETKISKLGVGSTFLSITQKDLKELEIPLPSYENQIRIANLLEKIETTIAERKNAIDLLDELVKATFHQMFGDPVRNEKGWRKDEIGKYADSIVPGRDKPKSFTGNIPWITTDKLTDLGHLDNNRISLFLSLDEIRQAKSKIIPSGSILMTCVGDLGIVSVTKFPSVANQQLHSYQCKTELNNIFTMYCLSLSKSYMYRMASTTTVPYMNKTICNTIPIIIPSITLQNQFADIAQKIEVIKAEQEAQLRDLEELYDSVSQKVFEGDIDLSKVPFDVSLLPNLVEVTKEEPIEKPEVILHQEFPKEQIKKVIKPITGKLTWKNISFKEIADYIRQEFDGHYFNAEMLLRFLRVDIGMQVNYFSSAEQKKNPQYENADDFYRFIATALTSENHFLTLEQVFYNAETENIPNMSFTENDLEHLSKKDKKERSGIYFRIKDETTTP